jgi:hypothetical protein
VQHSRESHPEVEDAFQIAEHRDVDHEIDLQGDSDEPAVAQEVPQCRSESQQRVAQTIGNARETAAEILIALGKSEWKMTTGNKPYARL